jgi:hypothetical protein
MCIHLPLNNRNCEQDERPTALHKDSSTAKHERYVPRGWAAVAGGTVAHHNRSMVAERGTGELDYLT